MIGVFSFWSQRLANSTPNIEREKTVKVIPKMKGFKNKAGMIVSSSFYFAAKNLTGSELYVPTG